MTATEETDVCEVVITAPDVEWLAWFSRRLVDDRLCAAAHLVPIRTVYRWRGTLHDTTEERVVLHTRMILVPQIVERANREHPYELPCVAATPIVGGSREYLEWIMQETAT